MRAPVRSDIAAILTPFINARLSHQRDANGYVIERTSFVDIDCPGLSMIDADIRGVGPEGITRFFYSSCELIRWEDIRSITVRGPGGDQTYAVGVEWAEAAE